MYTDKPIPHFEFPKEPKGKAFVGEGLVSVKDYFGGKILVEPVYFNQGYEGASSDCFIRKGAAERLEKALLSLPEGLTFKTFDGWRSVTTQEALYNKYYKTVKEQNPDKSEEELEAETKKFVSKPSLDPNVPSVHNTGGAIDLTLFDGREQRELNMGTAFDDFTPRAYTDCFENRTAEEEEESLREIRDNRRLLYYCMTEAGFTNLPTEWWHYDFGDNFWSFYSGKAAVYNGLLNTLPV